MSVTETKTAGEMSEALRRFAAHLDELGIVPISLNVGDEIKAHLRGADIDTAGDRFGSSRLNRYAGNVERVGHFGDYGVTVFAAAAEYDKRPCPACGHEVTR